MRIEILRLLTVSLSVLTSTSLAHAQQRVMSLDELYRMADENSQSIQVYETGRESAAESVKAARSAMLPDVNLSLSGSYIGNATLMDRGFSTRGTTEIHYAIAPYTGLASLGKQDTPHWGNNFAFEASQVLYAGGAISAGIRMAELGEQMAMLDVQKNRQEMRFLLTGYYLNLFKLDNQIKVLDKNIELTRELLKNMEARVEQGTVLKTAVTRYELQLQTLELNKTQLCDAASILNHQLVTTLHLPETTVIMPDTTLLTNFLPNSEESQVTWQELAAQSNVGLKQASLATELAEQKLKLAKSSYLPHLALVAEDHLSGPYTNDLIPVDANANAWFVGLGVQYELSSLWKNNRNVRKARLDVRKAEESLALAREGVENGVQANYVGFMTAFTEVRTQEKSVELADQNYAVTLNRYKNDLALLTDMLDASSVKLSADLSLVNARINLLYNYYKLKYISHTL